MGETGISPEMHQVLYALINDEGLQNIADEAAKVMGNPLWIIDINAVYLTHIAGDTKNARLLEENALGYARTDIMVYAKEQKMREKINASETSTLFESFDRKYQILNAAVRIADIVVGYIGVINEHHPFTEKDFANLDIIARIVSTELQKDSFYQDNKELMYSFLLMDILKNNIILPDIEKRMAIMGFSLRKYLYLLTVELKSVENRRIVLHSIQNQLHYICKDSLYCQYDQRLVFLFTTETVLEEKSSLMERLEYFLKDSKLKAAISNEFRDIRHIPHHYEKTLQALQIGNLHWPAESLYHYSALVTNQAVEILHSLMGSADFAGGAVGKILSYDEANHTELYATLKMYLEKGHSIPKTAKELSLHVNTVRQRLARIVEITDCSLDNGYVAFEIMLSSMLHEREG